MSSLYLEKKEKKKQNNSLYLIFSAGVAVHKDMKVRIGLLSRIELLAGSYRYSIVQQTGMLHGRTGRFSCFHEEI